MYSPEFIELLQKSGIDLVRHEEMGIAQSDFAELMISSGLVLTKDTKWISYHRYVDCSVVSALLAHHKVQWI